MTTDRALLSLLQIVDSGFPTGAFAFSNGLEGLAHWALLTGEAAVRGAIQALLEEAFQATELPAMRLAHRAAVAADAAALAQLDERLSALKPVPALRAASVKVGRRLMESATPLVPPGIITEYLTDTKAGRLAGHQAIALGLIFAALDIDETTAALAFGSSVLSAHVTATVRLGLIGQQAAGRIVASLHPAIVTAVAETAHPSLDDLGGSLPLAEIAALRQPALVGRLFSS